MLHTPDYGGHTRTFCGPTAIAAVTGVSIEKIYKMVRRVRSDRERRQVGKVLNGGAVRDVNGRKMPIKGMYNTELVAVMKRLGYRVEYIRGGMSFRQFLDDRGHLGPMIVNVTGHYIAVSQGMLCDNLTKVPAPIVGYPKNRRVKHAWMFKKGKRNADARSTGVPPGEQPHAAHPAAAGAAGDLDQEAGEATAQDAVAATEDSIESAVGAERAVVMEWTDNGERAEFPESTGK